MKARFILIVIFVYAISGCTLDLPFYSHEFRHKSSMKYSGEERRWYFHDVKGEGGDYMIQTFPQQKGSGLLILTPQGRRVSQINVPLGEINNVAVLSNPLDHSRVMFISVNTGKEVYLMSAKYTWDYPLKRETKVFESYPRNDNLMHIQAYKWLAVMSAVLLEDIDEDGRLELVVNATDSYSANPRGLMAYDYDTGKLKWFVRTPISLRGPVFDDFDGDGHKEFALGSISFKNTELSHKGLDDRNGHLLVIDRFGKLIYTEQVLRGLSEVNVAAEDMDRDGKPEVVVLALQRGSDASESRILHYDFDGKRLIRNKEHILPGNQESLSYREFLFKADGNSARKILVNDVQSGLKLYDELLNPIISGPIGINTLFDIGDVNLDGAQELLVMNSNDEIQLLDNRLKAIAGMRNPFAGKGVPRVELLQTGADSNPLMVMAMDDTISFYELTHISYLLYLYRLLESYGFWISLFFLAIIVRAMISLRHRDKALVVATNKCDAGFILINARSRIIFANRAAINLAQRIKNESNLEKLGDCFPEISEAVNLLRLSKAEHNDLELELVGEHYRIHIEKLPGLRRRYIISMSPPLQYTGSDMLAWAETARRLSHHVRRHITNVLLALDPIEAGMDEGSREYMHIVRSEIEKIRVFTHAFQRFTEMKSYDLKLIDVVPHVEHALQQICLPENVNLIRNYGLQSVHAQIEPIRFEEALINTLNNAIEAMPEGGSLHLGVMVFPKHSSPRGQLSVLVEVEDSGKGIPAKYMQDIWQPFFTTNQSGTGIGIPETKKILDSMGGILDIQSEEGVGTTVSLWLKGESDV
ncbi:MAG: ATP-binding protein [Candidatus Cloacimonetes bacterium]|nr:ATP-binding protein [Candidatus Cloacimonadota bacterium]